MGTKANFSQLPTMSARLPESGDESVPARNSRLAPNAQTPVSQSQKPTPKTNLTKRWPVVVGGLLLMIGVSLGVATTVLRQPQEVREQAAAPENTMTLKWRGRTDDGKIVVEVLLNSKSFNIAGVELHGTIEGVKSPSVVVSTSNPLGLQEVAKDLNDQSGQATDFLVTSFAPPNPSQLVSTRNADQVVATFTVSNPPSSGVTFKLANTTLVPALSAAEAVLELPGNQTFTVTPAASSDPDSSKKTCNQNCATDTECQSALRCYKGQCRHKDDLEDANCSKLKDNGLQRSCNQYCADGRECQSQFVCYFNQCRNPKNVTSSSCANLPSPSPKTTTSASKGSSGTGGTGSTTRVTPTPTPRVVAVVVTPTPSPRATATVSARPSATVSATPRASSSPKATASPRLLTPLPSPKAQAGGAGPVRTILAAVAVLAGLGLFGFSAYKLFKK